MAKYMEAAKIYPYYYMNPQLGSPINASLGLSVTPSPLNTSTSSQFGMPMPMPNPYMSYHGAPSMPVAHFGQLKNASRSMTPPSIPYGINPYSHSNGSIYPTHYVGSYPTSMLTGYGPTAPLSFSNAIGIDKN